MNRHIRAIALLVSVTAGSLVLGASSAPSVVGAAPNPTPGVGQAGQSDSLCVDVSGSKTAFKTDPASIGICVPKPTAGDAHTFTVAHLVGTYFNFETNSPRDAATGQATGKTVFSAVTFRHPVSSTSAQLLGALTTNERLPAVVFKFMKADDTGHLSVAYTITLHDASVSRINQYLPDTLAPAGVARVPLLEEVSFVFRSMEQMSADGTSVQIDHLGH